MQLGDKVVIVRPYDHDIDHNFVISSWLNNYYHGSADFTKHVSNSIYFKYHHLLLKRLLGRACRSSYVAVFEDKPDVILGFLSHEGGPTVSVIHYLYVKPAYRKKGVGRLLVSFLGDTGDKELYCSHLTKLGVRLLYKIKGLQYNPYFIG
jgi:GNAT superfamily N-acetyltransferase